MLELILSAHQGSSEELLGLSEVFDAVDAYIFIKDNKGKYQYVNRKVLDNFDVTMKGIKGKTDWHLFNFSVAKKMRINDKKVISTKKPTQQKIPFNIDNQELYHLTVSSPIIKNGKVLGVIGFAVDVSKDMEERQTLLEEANTDGLTGCFNRRYLHLALEQQKQNFAQSQTPSSLLIIDVDRFKPINDKYGHSIGDRVLIDVVKVIKRFTREEDMLCRYGGDEFVLLLPGSNIDQAYALAGRLSEKIDKLTFKSSGGKSFNVSCSIGVATHTVEDTNIIELADKALYVSKKGCSEKVHMHCPETQQILHCHYCDAEVSA
ncbi:sensor domain-containing diguanylate cyclase [Vibrio barjaei]|uniref:sensor domain-containing diguanylate cyclase n=1 Tax=Vibrio barjaei TaxID=1676683 RepID=UPI002284CB35|nr:sensor domain-containing diguanylate cyclase [Vibrio barjaei]MCY9871508.1 diguanylate cyclase [Vibrio barjaei]